MTSEKILIPLREFRGDTGWKIHKDGLLEAPDGRTEFPTTDTRGSVVGKHSYYLDRENVPVEVREK